MAEKDKAVSFRVEDCRITSFVGRHKNVLDAVHIPTGIALTALPSEGKEELIDRLRSRVECEKAPAANDDDEGSKASDDVTP